MVVSNLRITNDRQIKFTGKGEPLRRRSANHSAEFVSGSRQFSRNVRLELWLVFQDEKGEIIWICPMCKMPDDGSPMIGCDTCDDWYHWCVTSLLCNLECLVALCLTLLHTQLGVELAETILSLFSCYVISHSLSLPLARVAFCSRLILVVKQSHPPPFFLSLSSLHNSEALCLSCRHFVQKSIYRKRH